MSEKIISNEQIKSMLYTIFENYNNSSKKDYETKFVIEYISSLDKVQKSSFFKELENEIKPKEDELNNEEDECIKQTDLSLNYLYNMCLSKILWKSCDNIKKMENWIYNIINPNRINENLLQQMFKTINIELNNLNFDSYLHYILDKEENKTLEYISPSSDLYKLLLFEDMLRIDYIDFCNVKIDLDVEYIGRWWSENILPLFKKKYNGQDLVNNLELEIKKNEILDFHGKNFEKLKYKIIDEIEKEYINEKNLDKGFENEEKICLENNLKTKNSKSISDLEQVIQKIQIKYENNKEMLKDYCSDEFINILENNPESYTLKELEIFLDDNKDYFNDKAYIYFEVSLQKQIQKLEQELLNDICEVKDLKSLEILHNKLLENGKFVKCEDLERIIFRKMGAIIKTLNLAEINDEENIEIANSIYNNMDSIDLEKYPLVEILICRDINIDLNNAKNAIEDLQNTIVEIKEIVLKNCMFSCDYYNMNIQVNDSENYYNIKFRYLKDLIDYIKLKEGNTFLFNIKNINKNNQHKKRVFNKVNKALLQEIDQFYLEKN